MFKLDDGATAGRSVERTASRGYQRFSTEIHVREGETTPLNVALSREKP
jgi:hypothetical protein